MRLPLKTTNKLSGGGGGDEQNAQYKPLENEKQIKFEDQRKSKIRLMTGVFRAGLVPLSILLRVER